MKALDHIRHVVAKAMAEKLDKEIMGDKRTEGMSAILQKQVTLDDAVLSSSCFPNGCDYAFYFDGGSVRMGYGCYGVHTNLVTGARWYLHKWYLAQLDDPWRKLWMMLKPKEHFERVPLPVAPETILELKKREPCSICGAPFFKASVQED